jgi:hypothetical protein
MPDQGQRFSQLYLERGTPARDSQRFRKRLAAYYWEHLHQHHDNQIRSAMQRDAGIEVPFGVGGYLVSEVFTRGELRDVLDSITIIYQQLTRVGWKAAAHMWRTFVAQAMREENVAYVIDDECGVHYFVDQEFEHNRVSVLAILDSPRYAAVRKAFEDAYRHLDSDPRDTKAAVRSIFESLETLVRQMVETKNLNRWIVENTLKNRCLSVGNADAVEKTVADGLFSSIAYWVDAVHHYRHGQATVEPFAPSDEMAIHIISTGSAYIRWLCQFDAALTGGEQQI